MLIVVEDRNLQLLAQAPLDLEAAGRRDVLEIDATESGGDELDRADDLVDVLGVEGDRPRIDIGEALEQRGLALHHRHGGFGANITEPEDGRAVGDNRYRVALDREVACQCRVFVDRHADARNAGGVGACEVGAIAERHL